MKLLDFIRDKLTTLFAPATFKCTCCGAEIFDELGFCQECKKQVVYNNKKVCKRCGVGIDGEEDYCGNCAYDKVYFDRAYSAFSYEGAVQKAIVDMKFHNMGINAKILAKYLVYLSQTHNLQYDLVCFAPMTKKAKRARRYNQAQLLATYYCNMLGQDKLLVEAITKQKETQRQENLNRTERKENLIGAYKLNCNVKGKTVLVIDDIKTTGATLNECAKVLKRGGATKVICLTVASRKEKFVMEVQQDVQ